MDIRRRLRYKLRANRGDWASAGSRGRFRLPFAIGQHQHQRIGTRVQVLVRDNNVDQALKALKKKMQREGIFREMKLRNYFEKPSEKKAREKAEAVRRARKLARKKAQREGLIPGKPRTDARGKAGGRGGPGRSGPGAGPAGPPR
jgi:small subunit ribosomal protein S21